MRTVKAKLKNTAAVRKHTELMPVIPYETRGSSIVAVLRRFLEIREQLIEVSKRENSDYILKAITKFQLKTKQYYSMSSEIDIIIKSL